MGWNGTTTTTCPNCRQEKASEIHRSCSDETYYLVCTGCGLHLYAEYKQWVVSNSYIDNSIIGKNREDLCPEEIVDQSKNQDIIPEGSSLG